MLLINVKEEKRRLRARCKKLRAQCPADVKQRLDRALTAKVLGTEEYQSCDTLFIFVSSSIECDTFKIIADAFEKGKRVAVPRCADKSGRMDFYFISSFDDLSEGMYSLLEPDPEKCEMVTDFSKGLCIVPGLCFDLEGYRVGFGKGYYDRFLDDFGGTAAGICYSKFTVKQLPRGTHDRRTDMIITEKFINRNKRCMNGKQ